MADEAQLRLIDEQLAKVRAAWQEPTDWLVLSIFGFYAVENAVTFAADHFAVPWKKTHPSKLEAAEVLHSSYGLPDVRDLLKQLNALRLAAAYGEIEPVGQLDAEDLASQVEQYVIAVKRVVG